ncbi:hypothetical protein AGMMS50276_32880 [Synergistales bacterium]|nr:hypothetical protein AGMMS50276_32880 [Synergistales bacterium]
MATNLKSRRNATTIRFNDDYTRNVVYTAAQMQGQSLTGFILSAIRDKAETVIKERKQTMQEIENIILSPRASVNFIEALMNPPEPNEAILEGMKRYKSLNIKQAD